MIEDNIIGLKTSLYPVYEKIKKINNVNINTLLLGETGTGKTMFAKLIHQLSERKNENFVNITCTSLSPSLIESELFGYVKGAYTGASQLKPGLIELADGGTLFIDEIGDLSFELQSKLLEVLDTKIVRKIGSTQSKKVNFRLITATHRNLKMMVNSGEFRRDLYARIGTYTITIPPLRDRKIDILKHASSYLRKWCNEFQMGEKQFTSNAIDAMKNNEWSQNLRGVDSTIAQAIINSGNKNMITVDDLFPDNNRDDDLDISLKNHMFDEKNPLLLAHAYELIVEAVLNRKIPLDNIEKNIMMKILNKTGSVKVASQITGLSKYKFYRIQKAK